MKISHRQAAGAGGEQLKKTLQRQTTALKKEKVLKLPLGAYRLPVSVDRKEEKEKRERREGRKSMVLQSYSLVNRIISNNLGIIDSTKLFLTNPAFSFQSGLACAPEAAEPC